MKLDKSKAAVAFIALSVGHVAAFPVDPPYENGRRVPDLPAGALFDADTVRLLVKEYPETFRLSVGLSEAIDTDANKDRASTDAHIERRSSDQPVPLVPRIFPLVPIPADEDANKEIKTKDPRHMGLPDEKYSCNKLKDPTIKMPPRYHKPSDYYVHTWSSRPIDGWNCLRDMPMSASEAYSFQDPPASRSSRGIVPVDNDTNKETKDTESRGVVRSTISRVSCKRLRDPKNKPPPGAQNSDDYYVHVWALTNLDGWDCTTPLSTSSSQVRSLQDPPSSRSPRGIINVPALPPWSCRRLKDPAIPMPPESHTPSDYYVSIRSPGRIDGWDCSPVMSMSASQVRSLRDLPGFRAARGAVLPGASDDQTASNDLDSTLDGDSQVENLDQDGESVETLPALSGKKKNTKRMNVGEVVKDFGNKFVRWWRGDPFAVLYDPKWGRDMDQSNAFDTWNIYQDFWKGWGWYSEHGW